MASQYDTETKAQALALPYALPAAAGPLGRSQMPPTRRLRSVRRRRHGNGHLRSRREQRDVLRQRAKQRAGRAGRQAVNRWWERFDAWLEGRSKE